MSDTSNIPQLGLRPRTPSEQEERERQLEPAIKLEPHFRQFLAERFAYKRYRVTRMWDTLNSRTAKYDLYLRVLGHKTDFWPEGTLVIARIGFSNTKKGHGAALLRFIADQADDVGYTKIAIESANSDAEAFGVKFGFEHYRSNNFIADVATVRHHLLTRQLATAGMP